MSIPIQAPLLSGQHPAHVPGERRRQDLYPTPPALCRAILRALLDLELLFDGATVIEPHVGRGDWVSALDQVAVERNHRYRVTVHDLDPTVPGLDLRPKHLVVVRSLPSGDWLQRAQQRADQGRTWDLAVGNPPFANPVPGKVRGEVVAHHHVNATRSVARYTAMVLRDGLWTSSTDEERMAWALNERPRYRFDLAPRPSFTGDNRRGQFGSVAAVWGPHPPHIWTMSRVLDWRREGALADELA